MIEQTGEYMFYHVSFKSTSPGIEDTIELCTPVRQSISHGITISNPLNNQITFSASTNVPEISLPPNFVVGPISDVSAIHVPLLLVHLVLFFTDIAYI